MLRVLGIGAVVLGALMILRGLVSNAVPGSVEDEVLAVGLQQRLDGFMPGALLFVIGIVLLVWSRDSGVINAIPADQSITITITPEAAEFARRTIVERKYPPGSGLRVAEAASQNNLVVQFDLPSDSAEDWLAESLGIPVYVERGLVDFVSGKTIELVDRRLALKT
jgi:hypothetical protein